MGDGGGSRRSPRDIRTARGSGAGFDRRAFLAGAAAVAGGAALSRSGRLWTPAGAGESVVLPADPFTLGVASGDPLADAVVIWTRLAPDPLGGGGMPDVDVPVAWEVAPDEGFARVVASGTATASPDHVHAVHVDVTGLDPDSVYWYRFSAAGFDSAVGRTRTAPPEGCSVDRVRFGFASCQSWPSGYYPAHTHLTDEALDVVFFLGDYIYEGSTRSGVRTFDSGEVFTLDEYRNRYALYKTDPALQASHAAFPWFVIWDDHEVENNYANATSQDDGDDPPGTFLDRRAAAYLAWWEHQPVRLPAPTGPDLRIYRSFQWGGVADFFLLDGRQYRNDQACGDGLVASCAEREDPSRSMLGADQEQWLIDAVRGATGTWKVLANQTVFAGMPILDLYNMDQWDGYPASRQRILDALSGADGGPAVANPLVITGDIHAAGVAELRASYDVDDAPVIGTELVGTSISSGFESGLAEAAEAVIGGLPWVKYVDARHRGYTVVELNQDEMRADYRIVESVTTPESPVSTVFTYNFGAAALGSACAPPEGGSSGGTGASSTPVSPRFTG